MRDEFAAKAGAFAPTRDGFVVPPPSGERVLFAYDAAPAVQDLSVAGLVAAGFPSPGNAWGGDGVDTVASEDLSLTGGALFSQPARGLVVDADGTENNAIELVTAGTAVTAGVGLSENINTSYAYLFAFRAGDFAGLKGMFSNVSGGRGSSLYISTSGLVAGINSNGVNVSNSGTVGTPQDGAWHFAFWGHHAGDRLLHAVADFGTNVPVSTAALVDPHSSAIATKFGYNDKAFQFVPLARWEGVDAETVIDNRALLNSTWWVHGTDSTLSSYTRAGGQTTVGKPDSSGATVYAWGTGSAPQVGIGYDDVGLGGFRVKNNPTTTNLLAYSEPVNGAGWSLLGGGAAETLNDATNPLGYKRATKFTAAADPDQMYAAAVQTLNSYYVVSAYVYWDGTGVAPGIRVSDSISYYGNAYATAANTWQRISVAYQALRNSSSYIRLIGTTMGSGMGGHGWFAHAQIEEVAAGITEPGPFVPTNGATAVMNYCDPRFTGLAFDATTMRCEIVMSSPKASIKNVTEALRLHGAVGDQNGRILLSNGSAFRFYVYDETGALAVFPSVSITADRRARADYELALSDALAQLTTQDGVASTATVRTATPQITGIKLLGGHSGNVDSLGIHSIRIYKASNL